MARKIKTDTAYRTLITVNPEKVVEGLGLVYKGFSTMFEGLAEQMDQMQQLTEQLSVPSTEPALAVSTEKKSKTEKKDAIPAEDSKPVAEEEPSEKSSEAEDVTAEVPGAGSLNAATRVSDSETYGAETKASDTTSDETLEKPTVSITIDDLTKVIVAKIKQNRKNNEQIGTLLSAYGVKQLSDLPAGKYELFLNDISQL